MQKEEIISENVIQETYQEAISSQQKVKLEKAKDNEMSALKRNHTWGQSTLPERTCK